MKILFIIIGVLVIFFGFYTFRTVFFIMKTQNIIKKTIPFQRRVPWAPMRILVLGDSTAYGTGAESPEGSTAGRLGLLYPWADITNLSVNGLKIAGLLTIINDLDENERFDIVLIQIGANDIMRMTPMKNIREWIGEVITRVKPLGDTVILLYAGSIGEVPFFPFFLKPVMARRSLEVSEIYDKLALENQVSYVDLFHSPIQQKLSREPARYYSSDFLHLSSDGYWLWMMEIEKFLPR